MRNRRYVRSSLYVNNRDTERRGPALKTFSFLLRKPLVQISNWRSVILPSFFRGSSQSLQETSEAVPQTRPKSLHSTFFPVHHSPINLSFDGTSAVFSTYLTHQTRFRWQLVQYPENLTITRCLFFINSVRDKMKQVRQCTCDAV
jgi:hypothetical protein